MEIPPLSDSNFDPYRSGTVSYRIYLQRDIDEAKALLDEYNSGEFDDTALSERLDALVEQSRLLNALMAESPEYHVQLLMQSYQSLAVQNPFKSMVKDLNFAKASIGNKDTFNGLMNYFLDAANQLLGDINKLS